MARYGRTVAMIQYLHVKATTGFGVASNRVQGEEVYRIEISKHSNVAKLFHKGQRLVTIKQGNITAYEGHGMSNCNAMNTFLDCMRFDDSHFFKLNRGRGDVTLEFGYNIQS